MKLLHRVRAGESGLKRHGRVYSDLCRDETVVCIIPLNLLLRYSLEVYCWARMGGFRGPSRYELQAELAQKYTREHWRGGH